MSRPEPHYENPPLQLPPTPLPYCRPRLRSLQAEGQVLGPSSALAAPSCVASRSQHPWRCSRLPASRLNWTPMSEAHFLCFCTFECSKSAGQRGCACVQLGGMSFYICESMPSGTFVDIFYIIVLVSYDTAKHLLKRDGSKYQGCSTTPHGWGQS